MPRLSSFAGAALIAAAFIPVASASVGDVTSFSKGIPADADIAALATGPNGNLWFTEANYEKVGRLNPSTGAVTEIATPGCRKAMGISLVPDGDLWLACTGPIGLAKGHVVSVSPDGAPAILGGWTSAFTAPGSIAAAGVHGRVYVTDPTLFDGSIITMEADGTVGWMTPGSPGATNLAVGGDGNLWATSPGSQAVYRIPPDRRWEAPTATVSTSAFNSSAFGIATGPKGNLWVTNFGGANASAPILRVSPDGAVISIADTDGQHYDIARGPMGEMWFTYTSQNAVGRIDASGTVTTYPVATSGMLTGIIEGSDGNIWLASNGTDSRIYRILSGQVPVASVAPSISGSTAVGGTLTAPPGDWTYRPTSLDYRWERCTTAHTNSCAAIGGATSATYVVTTADQNAYVRARVVASNLNGPAAPGYSPMAKIDGVPIVPASNNVTPADAGGSGAASPGVTSSNEDVVGPTVLAAETTLYIKGLSTKLSSKVKVATPGALTQVARIGRTKVCTTTRNMRAASTATFACKFGRKGRMAIVHHAKSKVRLSTTFQPANWPVESIARTLTIRRPKR